MAHIEDYIELKSDLDFISPRCQDIVAGMEVFRMVKRLAHTSTEVSVSDNCEITHPVVPISRTLTETFYRIMEEMGYKTWRQVSDLKEGDFIKFKGGVNIYMVMVTGGAMYAKPIDERLTLIDGLDRGDWRMIKFVEEIKAGIDQAFRETVSQEHQTGQAKSALFVKNLHEKWDKEVRDFQEKAKGSNPMEGSVDGTMNWRKPLLSKIDELESAMEVLKKERAEEKLQAVSLQVKLTNAERILKDLSKWSGPGNITGSSCMSPQRRAALREIERKAKLYLGEAQ